MDVTECLRALPSRRVRLAPDRDAAYLPDLIGHQAASFARFLDQGIASALAHVCPIEDARARVALTLTRPELGQPARDAEACRAARLTYAAPLFATAELFEASTGEIIRTRVGLGALPLMLPTGTFLISGAEHVVLGQLGRSAGLYLARQDHDVTRAPRYEARVLPETGTRLALSGGPSGAITARLYKHRVPLVLLLQVMLAHDGIALPTVDTVAALLRDAGVDPNVIDATLAAHPSMGAGDAMLRLGRALHPGEPMAAERAHDVTHGLFSDQRRYDLGATGRLLLDRRLGRAPGPDRRTLTAADVAASAALLAAATASAADPATAWPADDQDHLATRRVRLVGELLEESLRRGVRRLAQHARRRMAEQPGGSLKPAALIAPKTVSDAIDTFFHDARVAPRVNQSNPLAELTHKRTLTLLGVSGLTDETAGLTVRDVHYSYYGRICPVENPEGPKIGLTVRLASGAVVTPLGFIAAPYRRVLHALDAGDPRLVGRVLAADERAADGRLLAAARARVDDGLAAALVARGDPVAIRPWVSDEIAHLTADEEEGYAIADGTAARDAGGHLTNDAVAARRRGQPATLAARDVAYIDASPRQLLSVTTGLIPYVEHDDAYRALMGSNMQRQAVALIDRRPPLVATGMERHAARGSGQLVMADRAGVVVRAAARPPDGAVTSVGTAETVEAGAANEAAGVNGPSSRYEIVVRGNDGVERAYALRRYARGNGGATLTQRPCVRRGQRVEAGDVLADCAASLDGELALGQNVIAAYLPYKGSTYEDAITVSARLVREDVYTSRHYEVLSCEVRDTENGPEEVRGVIPGCPADERGALDEASGLPRIGAEVGPHDVVVGKVTPRPGARGVAPAGRLETFVRTVLGEVEPEPRDTSARMGHGHFGTVVAVYVVRRADDDAPLPPWVTLARVGVDGPELPRGVRARVVVTLAHKRKLVEGDKMAGRHGNKGVIARIAPPEDMPMLPDGTPVDIILNPVGVPKRMNLGQVLEAHLGLAAAALGYRVETPAFEGIPEDRWRDDLVAAGLPPDGKVYLRDGETGERYEHPSTVGVVYMLKLGHLAEDKAYARSVGPYAALTQQPLQGKSRGGGQRIGEMELWALEAWGARRLQHEMFTLKSDDVDGRGRTYRSILAGEEPPRPGGSGSFALLQAELAALRVTLAPRGDGYTLGLASDDDVRAASCGEVANWHTLHEATLEPVKGGLFCDEIFGPRKDYRCRCGRYNGAERDVDACPECNVPLLPAAARRARFGHVELAIPVLHPWFARGTPNHVAAVLGVPGRALERVLAYDDRLVLHVDEEARARLLAAEATTGLLGARRARRLGALAAGEVLAREDARVYEEIAPGALRLGAGAAAVAARLAAVDLDALERDLAARVAAEEIAGRTPSALARRLLLVRAVRRGGQSLAAAVIRALPVLPPALRPVVYLDGNRFAVSDTTELYRLIIQRNERLKRLRMAGGVSLVVEQAERDLQHAVDALIANGERGIAPLTDKGGKRPRVSLTARLARKEGRFRQTLLGKRVDYSGRSVIVVGPDLRLHQCGLPRLMARELFRPFVAARLVAAGVARTPRAADRLIDRGPAVVWRILAEVMEGRAILLNRAPTLHRLSMQAYQPVLVDGSAIQLHPLACESFNADFDGDQMGVHVPLSREAQMEAKTLMLASRNLLSPADGSPKVAPAKDMVIGLHMLTRHVPGELGDGRAVFATPADAVRAAEAGAVGMHAAVWLHAPASAVAAARDGLIATPAGRVPVAGLAPLRGGRALGLRTTPGRLALNSLVAPAGAADGSVPARHHLLNAPADKGSLAALLLDVYREGGPHACARAAEALCALGFAAATRSGISLGIGDFAVPAEKAAIMAETRARVSAIGRDEELYRRGLLSRAELGRSDERRLEEWFAARDAVGAAARRGLPADGALMLLAGSGAAKGDVNQLVGMRGVFADVNNRVIPFLVAHNLREGMTPLEYFVSTRGARKGLVDTALKTADGGYLTRRFADALHDVVARVADCGATDGLTVAWEDTSHRERAAIEASLLGRRLAVSARDLAGHVVVGAGVFLGETEAADLAARLFAGEVAEVTMRSPLTCRVQRGVCQACYGWSMATRRPVPVGEAVGIIAAQSLGEQATQLVLRTFHTGGVAAEDITTGLPRVEQIVEARRPKPAAVLSPLDGVATVTWRRRRAVIVVLDEGRATDRYRVPVGYAAPADGATLAAGDPLLWAERGGVALRAPAAGRVERRGRALAFTYAWLERATVAADPGTRVLVADGDVVRAGEPLAVGASGGDAIAGDPLMWSSLAEEDVLRLHGARAAGRRIVDGLQRVYRKQGVIVHDKHAELVARQMLRHATVVEPGDTMLLPGERAALDRIVTEAARALAQGGEPPVARRELLGITRAALATESFLSAASFQETARVLADAAIVGAYDPIVGLKEAVIVARPFPAGPEVAAMGADGGDGGEGLDWAPASGTRSGGDQDEDAGARGAVA